MADLPPVRPVGKISNLHCQVLCSPQFRIHMKPYAGEVADWPAVLSVDKITKRSALMQTLPLAAAPRCSLALVQPFAPTQQRGHAVRSMCYPNALLVISQSRTLM